MRAATGLVNALSTFHLLRPEMNGAECLRLETDLSSLIDDLTSVGDDNPLDSVVDYLLSHQFVAGERDLVSEVVAEYLDREGGAVEPLSADELQYLENFVSH